MARPSKLTPEQWIQVRDAAIAGVPYEKLAFEFGITVTSIKQAAKRNGWATPKKVEKLQEQYQSKEKTLVTHSNLGVNGIPNLTKSGGELIAETLLQNGEKGSLTASNLALSLLLQSTPEKLKPLADISDLGTALNVVRKAAGMDKQAVNVGINLPGWAASVSMEKSVSADFTEITDMPPDCTETDSDQ